MQEKRIQMDIRKSAAQNQVGVCKIYAKDIVRTRAYMQRFARMRAQLQAVSLRMQAMTSTQEMNKALAGCSAAMARMNKQIDIPSLRKIAVEFSKNNAKMEMTQEMMEGAIDDVLGESDEEEEASQLVAQVFDELGIGYGHEMGTIPSGATIGRKDDTNELNQRLSSLE
eukprot:gnl/Chilomastix_cuspidata/2612.p1 GENE.gnl/Chilomastix_cuspidata/2612~~gnl/Chilomastix_cuspidata/2612.p1  ORF type:complete len:169 (-),score=57.13 gnl/Chilomastix_cuspidata/2612:71-577(-)